MGCKRLGEVYSILRKDEKLKNVSDYSLLYSILIEYKKIDNKVLFSKKEIEEAVRLTNIKARGSIPTEFRIFLKKKKDERNNN